MDEVMSNKAEDACKWSKSENMCECRNESSNLACWDELTSQNNVDFLIAINPQALEFENRFKIKPPSDPNTLSQQLFVRHRNSYEVCMFLEFLKHTPFSQSHLDNGDDKELDVPTLPRGRLPVWVEKGAQVPDLEVLEFIREDHIFDHESVTLIYRNSQDPDDPELDDLSPEVRAWCEENNWKCVMAMEAVGGEDEVVVVLGSGSPFEECSRGRNGLIVLTTRGLVHNASVVMQKDCLIRLRLSFPIRSLGTE